MDTQSQDTTRMTRIEAARNAALGTLSRARETLQVAATTVPAWARGVEIEVGEQFDALLHRVGLVRIARVEAQRPSAETATPAVVAVEEVPVVSAESAAVMAEAPAEAPAEVTAEAPAEVTAEVTAVSEQTGDRSGRRRRR